MHLLEVLCVLFLIPALISCVNKTEPVKKSRVLMLSFDGIRADKFDAFIKENPKCNFSKIISAGVKADYMIPSFPSVTFPNHWTLVTGLYPESHGIIGNVMYDPIYNDSVNFIYGKNGRDPKWWNQSEPLWMTATRQGLKTAGSGWPGSDVLTRTPDLFLSPGKYENKDRIDMMIDWLKNFHVNFACIYFNEPDSAGHSYGEESQEYNQMIGKMDQVLGYLLQRIQEVNLSDSLNLLIVSDHGMATIKSRTDQILVNNFIESKKIDSFKSIFGEVSNIYPANKELENEIYLSLKKIPNVQVYLKNDVPKQYHFNKHHRIAPIVVIANEGYFLTNNPNYTYYPGHHGYNNSLESMKTIFIAQGPNFEANRTIQPFVNVDVYPLLCEILKIECNSHNGTMSAFKSVFNSTIQLKLNFVSLIISILFSLFFSF